jgi:hypothetical protein
MGLPIATMSIGGWITEVSAKLDYELYCMATTDALQTNTYVELVSFPKIIQENKGDIDRCAQELKAAIAMKLSRCFDNVDIKVTYQLVDPTESRTVSKITLVINFTEDGVAHNASRALMFYNGKFKTFSEANNG